MVPAGWHTLGISACWHAFDHLPGLFHVNEKAPCMVPSQHVLLPLTARTEQASCRPPPACPKHEQSREGVIVHSSITWA